ncbi:MAG: type II secretion system protein N [Pseudomonadota bacterium]|nr:type II secretion system protein N [Pseudomonadota bacterium]
MKSLQKYLLGLGVLLLALGLVLWFLPARWATPWIETKLHGLQLQQVHGTVWQGRSDQVVAADGQTLGKLQWQLSRRALLGQGRLHLSFDGPSLTFSGIVSKPSEPLIDVRDVTMRTDLGSLGLPAVSPLGQPRGDLQVSISHALLQGGWPMELQLQAQWQQAVMHTQDGDVALGTLALQAQSQGGVVQAQIHDTGNGPLAAAGELQLSPLGWRLDATLSSRQTDPKLDRWLATLGPVSADGRVHIQQRGGLAATLPSSAVKPKAKQP